MCVSVSIGSVSQWSISRVTVTQDCAMSQTMAIGSVRVADVRGQEVTSVHSVSGESMSQRMSVSSRSDDRLLDFRNMSNWFCGDQSSMTMSQTVSVSVSQRIVSIGSQVTRVSVTRVSVTMSQSVRSDGIIVSSDRSHVFGDSGVGGDDGDCVMCGFMSQTVAIGGMGIGCVRVACMGIRGISSVSVTVSEGSISSVSVTIGQMSVCQWQTMRQSMSVCVMRIRAM